MNTWNSTYLRKAEEIISCNIGLKTTKSKKRETMKISYLRTMENTKKVEHNRQDGLIEMNKMKILVWKWHWIIKILYLKTSVKIDYMLCFLFQNITPLLNYTILVGRKWNWKMMVGWKNDYFIYNLCAVYTK